MDIERLRISAAAFGREPLLVSPDGHLINLAEGYIPLLANFTFEDKAAKGLRKRKAEDKLVPPVYFSALELVRDHRILLLSGTSGSGKTSFAKHLASRLATTVLFEPRPLVRNESGAVHDEHWEAGNVSACYFAVDGPESLKTLVNNTLHKLMGSFQAEGNAAKSILLIILDTIEKAGDEGPNILTDVLAFIKHPKNIKLLLLGETSGAKHWVLPSDERGRP